jgi:hypothetical protein
MKLTLAIAALAFTIGAAFLPVAASAQTAAPTNGVSAQSDAPTNGVSSQLANDQAFTRNVASGLESRLTVQSLSSASPSNEILTLAPRVNNSAGAVTADAPSSKK